MQSDAPTFTTYSRLGMLWAAVTSARNLMRAFLPHETLTANGNMPQTSWLHLSPGFVHVPQLALQQT